MTTDYSNEKRGVLFKNADKQKETHPDYKGSVTVDGVEYWLSSWIKTSKKGDKFMSLSLQPKEQAKPASQAKQAPQPVEEDFEDDIPF